MEDEERRSAAIDKRCRLAESRAEKVERGAEELRLNLKSRGGAEGGFIRNLASGIPPWSLFHCLTRNG